MAIDLNELATAIGQLVLRFRVRRRLAADWVATNEILLPAEFGLETDTNKLKIGDGVKPWNTLPYFGGTGGSSGTILTSENAGNGISITQYQPTTGGGDGNQADDPSFSNVVTLLHFEGEAGDTSNFDSGPLGLTVAQQLNSGGNFGGQIISTVSRYGASSMQGRWAVGNDSSMNFGSSDWTIEGYAYPTDTANLWSACLVSIGDLGPYHSESSPTYPPQGVFIVVAYDGTITVALTDSSSVKQSKEFAWDRKSGTTAQFRPNQWSYFCVQRQGNIVTVFAGDRQMYINQFTEPGATEGVTARYEWDIGAVTLRDTTAPMIVGGILSDTQSDNQGWTFPGFMDEVRVTKAVARKTSAGSGLLTVASVADNPAPVTVFPGYGTPALPVGDPYPIITNTGVVNLVAGDGIALTTQVVGSGDDPYWSNVSMLLHFDGPNNSTTTRDSSSLRLPITAIGHAALSTSRVLFGQSSGLIPTMGGGWSTPDSTAFDMQAGDWTMEAWFNPIPWSSAGTGHAAVANMGKFANLGTANTAALGFTASDGIVTVMLIDSGGTSHKVNFYDYRVPTDGSYDPSHPTYVEQNPSPWANNQWNHIVIERIGNEIYCYVNGWQSCNNSDTSTSIGALGYPTVRGGWNIGSISLHSLESPFAIGNGGGEAMYGGIDEVRITKGVGRYTGLTIDVPTAAYWSSEAAVVTETVVTNTRAGIVLSGAVATYSLLPTGLGSVGNGKAYLCWADNLIYVWNGSAFPASGAGASLH